MGNLIREQIPGDFCTKGEFTEVKAEQLIKQPQDTEKNRSNCPLSTTRWRVEKSALSHVRKHGPVLTAVRELLPWEHYSWKIPPPPTHTLMCCEQRPGRPPINVFCMLPRSPAFAILSKYIIHQSSDSDLMPLLQNEDTVITSGRDKQYSNRGHVLRGLTSFSLGWGVYFWHNNGGAGQGPRSSPSYSGIPHHRSHWPCC